MAGGRISRQAGGHDGRSSIYSRLEQKEADFPMMKVFICPTCGWMRVVSRRKDVECYKCGEKQMTMAKVDFTTFSAMSEEERKDYADGWIYIHQKSKR